MKADSILLQLKYDGVIEAFARYNNIPLREALDLFYKSRVYQEMRVGVSDMHCRSDTYLAEELAAEMGESGVFKTAGAQ
jgi:hypothetical protein